MEPAPSKYPTPPWQLAVLGLGFLVIAIVGIVIGVNGDAHHIKALNELGVAMCGIGLGLGIGLPIKALVIQRKVRKSEEEVLRMQSGKD